MTANASASPRAVSRPGGLAVLIVGVVLTGLSMRTAVGSIGAVLDELEAGLGATSAASGVITTLPVVCFAVVGSFAPGLARRFGMHRTLAVALAVMAVGLVARALAGAVWQFGLLSVLALTGGAVSNVLMPALVKADFPDRVGPMTAVYTTSLAIGLTGAVGLTVPISDATGGWRWGLASWALIAAVGVVPWLLVWRHDRPLGGSGSRVRLHHPGRSRLAWALMLFFSFQSFQAYISYGWFPTFLRDQGISATRAGLLVAVFAALSIPMSIVVPSLAPRGQHVPILAMVVCSAVGYAGMLIAPVGGAVAWMALTGIGAGAFPLALTMISLHTRDVDVTAATSGFVQGIGYVLAGSGPLLTGVLHGATGGWGWPFVLLFIALGLSAAGGLYAASGTFVDDDLRLPGTPS